MPTTQENKSEILGDFWVNYKIDPDFEDFISYNDLGLPLGYAISMNIVRGTELSDKLINESFQNLLDMFELADSGFENLQEILDLRD